MIISSQQKKEGTKKDKQRESKALQELEVITTAKNDTAQLRPDNLDGYIGQEKIVRQLRLIIQSAQMRETVPEHMLFHGQPGLGKTTMANLISSELQAHLKTVAAPSLQKTGDIVALLMNLEPNTVLFIDEIHRLKAPLEEVLYSAMEDKVVDIIMGKGQGVSVGRFDLNPFVLVGATTQLGKVSKPLKDRFPSVFHLQPYTEAEILSLLERNMSILDLQIDEAAKNLICGRCRGVPRVANNILKRFLDLQIVHRITTVNKGIALEFLEELGIYDQGLTRSDYNYLRALKRGSLGLKTLSGVLMEDSETLEVVTEPYLIYLGLIDKSSDGRKLTAKGRDLVDSTQSLFN